MSTSAAWSPESSLTFPVGEITFDGSDLKPDTSAFLQSLQVLQFLCRQETIQHTSSREQVFRVVDRVVRAYYGDPPDHLNSSGGPLCGGHVIN